MSLPKPPEKLRTPIEKTLSTFSGEGTEPCVCFRAKKLSDLFAISGILTSALFRDISASLADGEWRRLASSLGMTRIRIEAIERDYRYDAPYYMLLTWFKRVSRSSDKVSVLTHALVNIKRWDLAQELQTIKNTKRLDQSALSKDGTYKKEYKLINKTRDIHFMFRAIENVSSFLQSYLSARRMCTNLETTSKRIITNE